MLTHEMPLVLVHVAGRRVAWSADPLWFPRDKARGDAFNRARRHGLAGWSKERADHVVRRLLSGAVRGVLVTGQGIRAAYVTRPAVGGSIRTAWSDSPEWWPTIERNQEYARARAAGRAGVVYGADALLEVLHGGIVEARDWRAEEAAARARKASRAPTLEERARAARTVSGSRIRAVPPLPAAQENDREWLGFGT